jgi:hypothetical protein
VNRNLCIASILFASLCSAPGVRADSSSDENSDLETIPKNLASRQSPGNGETASSEITGKSFIESALTCWADKDDLMVPTGESLPSYQERLSLDLTYEWEATRHLKFDLSDRLNGFAGDTISFPSSGCARNDFREAFASCEIVPQAYLEVGRINIKNGPALGFNPTDFFKTRAQVDLVSIDPSASKEDRLGVLMIELQRLFDGGAFTLAYAPGIQPASRLSTGAPACFDPLFGQTNSSDRLYASLSSDVLGLSPQEVVYHDELGTHFGGSLSKEVSNSMVAYAEWSGVEEKDLSSRAISFGESTGSLPQGSPIIPQPNTNERFQKDAAIGGSWTSASRLTVNLEFHYHQSAFSEHDFDQWVSLGRSNMRSANELWFIREYASDQQEPLMQQEVFVRLDWQDAFVRYLDLGLVSFVNPHDGSTLSQLSAKYDLSKKWTFGIYVGGTTGGSNTERGSIPWVMNSVFELVRYL